MPIELPDIRQDTGSDCGKAVATCVWELRGVKKRPIPWTPLDGTAPDTLEAVLWQSGLSLQSGCMDIGDLKYHTSKGRPVICLLTEAGVTGHWVVVSGVRYRQVHFHCPIDGPSFEPIVDFERRWLDQTRRGEVYVRWGIAVE
jgi:hypothetical protein